MPAQIVSERDDPSPRSVGNVYPGRGRLQPSAIPEPRPAPVDPGSTGLTCLAESMSGEAGVSRYRRLRDALAVAIEAGELGGGDMLPSSRLLAGELGVSRNTVNRAYRELVADGFVQSIERVGYVINSGLGRTPADSGDRAAGSFPTPVDWDRLLGGSSTVPEELSKPVDWRTYPYPFVVGPGPESFPTGAWTRAMRTALREEHRGPSLHNLEDRDDPLLVEQIRDTILPARGIEATADEILVTLGSQHGIHLVAEALLSDRGTVGVEEPGYPDARDIFVRQGTGLVGLPVDDQGVIAPAHLSDLDLVFVTPGRQFPTNVTMTVGRRRDLLSRADRDDVVIIEDDYDSEYCYGRRPPPALKSIDRAGRVVYVGSFSKFLAPGLRLGFVVADARLVEHLRRLRHHMLRHPPGIIQRTTALMMEAGDYGRVIRRHRRVLRSKWQAATEAVSQMIPWQVPVPDGGMSLWVSGPASLDATALAMRARDEGVVIEPGDVCFLGEDRPANYFRMGFAAIELEAIRPGVERLAALL